MTQSKNVKVHSHYSGRRTSPQWQFVFVYHVTLVSATFTDLQLTIDISSENDDN